MPEYELYYFDTSGRAAVARMLFKLAKVEFKDTRYSREEWATVKQNRAVFPFNQVPVLRVDNHFIAESTAIIDYLAHELGYHGSTNLECARVNMIRHHLASLGSLMIGFIFQPDKELAGKLKEKFFSEHLPKTTACLEELLLQRSNGDKYFLGEKLTLADLVFLDASLFVTMIKKDSFDDQPKLKALIERVSSIPAIAEYLPTRKVVL